MPGGLIIVTGVRMDDRAAHVDEASNRLIVRATLLDLAEVKPKKAQVIANVAAFFERVSA